MWITGFSVSVLVVVLSADAPPAAPGLHHGFRNLFPSTQELAE
jgi:hypothetical protein